MFQIIPRQVIARRMVPLTVRGIAPRLAPLHRQNPVRFYSDKKDADKPGKEAEKKVVTPSTTTTTTTTQQEETFTLRQKLPQTSISHQADQLRKQLQQQGEEATATTAKAATSATPVTPAAPTPASPKPTPTPAPTAATPTPAPTAKPPAQEPSPPQPPKDLPLRHQLRLLREATDSALKDLALQDLDTALARHATAQDALVNTLGRIERRTWAWRLFLSTLAVGLTMIIIPEDERDHYLWRARDVGEEVKGWFVREVREARKEKKVEGEREYEELMRRVVVDRDRERERERDREGVLGRGGAGEADSSRLLVQREERLSILSKFVFLLFWCFCWSGGFEGLVLPGRVFRGGRVD
ncbi:hypothetical protein QBC41DRAFT_309343 [Cercophora samala]|uniref:Uncharacterized protein n=1 Tax=Cercophora samala TaxID=330535 RepID=A0AA39ZNZ0_9PEZI|nr:hypothetical protein QBC41DRAFT_309343 [Cercophora samala]